MEFRNEFTVPVGADRAFAILTDLERVAPCLPGATLEEVDGDVYSGKVKVKVGPIQVVYQGSAELVEQDSETKHAVIRAKGREARGAGTASADVTADLVEVEDGLTRVTVATDLAITGKPAQFGRGVMADVGTKLIDTFAQRLEAMVQEDEGGDSEAPTPSGGDPSQLPAPADDATPMPLPPPVQGETSPATDEPLPPATTAPTADATTPATPASPPAATGPRRIPPPAVEPEALDLMDVAGGALRKRLVPVAVAAVVVGVAIVLWRRRG